MRYALIIFLLFVLYVLSNSALGFLNPISYILIVYIACLDKIDETNYIRYALIFGLFSDFERSGFIGVGVLMFLFYGVLTIKAGLFFDMHKFFSRFFFRFALVAVHVFINLAMTDYLKANFVAPYLYYLSVNTLVLIALVLIMEVSGAFKSPERRSSGVL